MDGEEEEEEEEKEPSQIGAHYCIASDPSVSVAEANTLLNTPRQ